MKKGLLITATVLFGLKVVFFLLRLDFTDPRMNYVLLMGFFLSFPMFFLYLLLAKRPKKPVVRLPLIFLTSLLCLGIFLPFSCYLMLGETVFSKGFDPSYQKVREIQLDTQSYTAYRTNYEGALGDFGIDIRKESRILFLIHFRILGGVNHAYDARFYQVDNEWFAEVLRTGENRDNVIIKLQ